LPRGDAAACAVSANRSSRDFRRSPQFRYRRTIRPGPLPGACV